MGRSTVTVEGLPELNARLQAVKLLMSGKELEGVCIEGARLIRDTAKGMAPVGPTGNYKRAIAAFKGRKAFRYGAAAVAWVKWKGKTSAPHAFWVEYGIPHDRTPKTGAIRIALSKIGATGRRGKARVTGAFGYLFARKVGPMPAQHVFQRAAESRMAEVADRVESGVRKLFDGVTE